MRIILDTNVWSSAGDDGSVREIDSLIERYDLTLQIPPSLLVEVVNIPHEDVRKRIITAMGRGARRERLTTEADQCASELIALVRRTRPEWLHKIPNPAVVAKFRTYWLKKIWREALEDSTRLYEVQQGSKSPYRHVLERQKYHRAEILRTGFVMGNLMELMAANSSPIDFLGLPWDGGPTAAWRVSNAQLWWYQLCVVGLRSSITREDRTFMDWVEPFVNIPKMRASATSYAEMWYFEAQAEEVPRNWLAWAVDIVQATMKVGSGNPADAQHSSYLVDCDLFLTADARFAEILERVRQDAPFDFARTVRVSGDRSTSTAERIEAALQAAGAVAEHNDRN